MGAQLGVGARMLAEPTVMLVGLLLSSLLVEAQRTEPRPKVPLWGDEDGHADRPGRGRNRIIDDDLSPPVVLRPTIAHPRRDPRPMRTTIGSTPRSMPSGSYPISTVEPGSGTRTITKTPGSRPRTSVLEKTFTVYPTIVRPNIMGGTTKEGSRISLILFTLSVLCTAIIFL